MDVLDTLTQRNHDFVAHGYSSSLKIIPSMKTLIIGCVDPRVDPGVILGLAHGEAAIIRNIGGRLNSETYLTMAVLRTVAKAAGGEIGPGWNLIVLHHTDCGIVGCYHHGPDILAKYLGVTRAEMENMAITDPYAAVAKDVATLKANPQLPGAFTISGVVYDVATGLVHTVVAPALLRPD